MPSGSASGLDGSVAGDGFTTGGGGGSAAIVGASDAGEGLTVLKSMREVSAFLGAVGRRLMRLGRTGNLGTEGFFSASSMLMILYEFRFHNYKAYPESGQRQTLMNIRTYPKWTRLLVLATVLLAGSACEPMAPPERAYFNRREEARIERERLMRGANDVVRAADLFELVRDSAAPDEPGNTSEWLERQMQAMGGQVMFPRWTATRRGSNKQDVRFDFVHIDDANNTRRIAYIWPVDVLTMTVGEVRLDEVEQSASPDQSMLEQELRRIREHEQALQ
jgi:hypothetical protein